MFDCPGQKGENKDRNITIKWQDTFETESRFIYYNPQIEMFARFKMKSSFHKTKRII